MTIPLIQSCDTKLQQTTNLKAVTPSCSKQQYDDSVDVCCSSARMKTHEEKYSTGESGREVEVAQKHKECLDNSKL